ncbi:DinB family protein [Rubrivirga sp. S365]|uniref:DinB family protein n=1 Tax=Rubrivirga sp. S365 TaxID=3076080 RepID=UPI0028C9614C|nr:DinB family protein [Rubrivirga sp. S365]MDT7857074.1 DinB family protein [Rubrivirga sp. S365]
MSPQLQSYADAFSESRRRLHALAGGVGDDAFNRKPSAKAWSAGECVVHLNRTAAAYLPALEAALGAGAPRGEGPFRWGWVARRFVEAVRPGSRSVPTFGGMRPPRPAGLRSDVDRARAVAQFDADAARWLALCERAEGVDLGRVRVRSPFVPLLKLPAGAFLEAMGLHALRHVGQAERAVERPPSAGGGADS